MEGMEDIEDIGNALGRVGAWGPRSAAIMSLNWVPIGSENGTEKKGVESGGADGAAGRGNDEGIIVRIACAGSIFSCFAFMVSCRCVSEEDKSSVAFCATPNQADTTERNIHSFILDF
jgi:hypothetical protein